MTTQLSAADRPRAREWASAVPPALLAIALILLAPCLQPEAASAASPLSWSSPVLVDHQEQPAWGLNGVSCPSSSLCVAVDEAGNVFTSTNPTGGPSAWSPPTSVDPGHVLRQVSCPTTGLCAAVDNAGNVLTSTNPGGGASAWTVTNLVAGDGALGVTCVSASLCMVVGSSGLFYSTDPAGGAGTWTNTHALAGYTGFFMISCASSSLCVAGDEFGDLESSTNPTGGESAWQRTAVGSETTAFESASCPSTSLCLVGENYGNILTSTTPSTGPWTTTNSPDGSGVNGISCPATTLCVAVDFSGHVVTSTNPTGGSSAWAVASVGGNTDAILGVSCPTTNLCVAVDSQGNVLTSTNPTGGASAWSTFSVDGPADRSNVLSSVSCPQAPPEAFCAAVDDAGNVLTSTNPGGGASAWAVANIDGTIPLTGISCQWEGCIAVDELGNMLISPNPMGGASTWTKTLVDPGNGGFTGVSCPPRDVAQVQFCLAVDHAGNAVISFNGGSSWNIEPIDTSGGHLTGLSCTEFSEWCIAWDDLGNVLTSKEPAEGASTWTLTSIDPGTSLTGASCPYIYGTGYYSAWEYCLAVDPGGNALTAAKPTGGTEAWTSNHIEGHGFTGVSCPFVLEAEFCAAVDDAGNVLTSTNPFGGAAAWSVTPIDPGISLTGVSCPYSSNSGFCLAVAANGDVIVGTPSGEEPAPKEEPKPKEEPPGGESFKLPPVSCCDYAHKSPNTAQLKAVLANQLLPVGKVTIGSLLKHGGLTMSFTAPEAGSLSVQWYELPSGAKLAKHTKPKPVLIALGKLAFSAARTGQLKLRLTAQGRRLLKHARRVKLEVRGRFTPTGGTPVSLSSGFQLKRQRGLRVS
jgi:hypothetical protein